MAEENGSNRVLAQLANLPGDTRELLVALSSAAVGRMNFARRAGLQYGNERDVYKVAGYVMPGSESFDDYWSLYDRDALAGRIVDAPASTTWKTPPEVIEPGYEDAEEGKGSAFMEAFKDLSKRLALWHRLERVDRLSRIGRYGILLIGTAGTDDDLKNEVMRVRGPQDILYLSAFHEKSALIKTWETDPSSPRFGLPVLYEVELSNGSAGFPSAKRMIHHSRIIHVAEDLLDDEVHGRPALKRALNPLFDLQKVGASTGEGFWQVATRTLVGSIDKEAAIDKDGIKALGEALEEITHDLRRHFIARGAELDWLSTDPPDPTAAADFFLSLLSASSGIPKRILLGSERGELASSQDERNFFGMINERQENHAEPNILRAFIDRMIKFTALPAPKEEYKVIWPELYELSEKEKAEANASRANAAKALTPVGGDPMDIVEIDSNRDVWLKPTAVLEEEGFFEEEEPPEPTPPPPPPQQLPPDADGIPATAGDNNAPLVEGED